MGKKKQNITTESNGEFSCKQVVQMYALRFSSSIESHLMIPSI